MNKKRKLSVLREPKMEIIKRAIAVSILFLTVPILLSGCGESGIFNGYLEIDSHPQGATVYVNDKLVGQTPCRGEFTWMYTFGGFGAHVRPPLKIVVIKKGYFREERSLWKRGDVEIKASDPGSEIQRGPAKARIMFYLTKESPATSIEIPISKDEQEEQQMQQQQQVMGPTIVTGGRTVTGEEAVKIVNYGMVKFDSTPQRAEVLVEGNLVGYTPTSYLKFQVGTYSVEIIKTGYQSWRRKIMVIQDSSIVINPQLEQEES